MKVSIFGSGYVGLVTGACLAEMGNDVCCVDIDEAKIATLNSGGVPIYEPGLTELIQENRQAGRLTFTTDIKHAVDHGLFQFIAVGTPPDEDGSADLQYVLAVAKSIGENMEDYKIIIDKSTVPVGTADKVRAQLNAALQSRDVELEFDVVSNPEFLKEGDAIGDFMKPDRIVVGVDNDKSSRFLRELYAPFNRNHERLVVMDIRSAELTKYAANSMLATKISFMNEMANLAEVLGADIESVRRGIGSDSRIGYSFIYPGAGYGGSCFPKDVQALERTARQNGYDARLLQAVEAVNYDQKKTLFTKIQYHFKGDIKGKVFALWGLAFKPNTDDMREAPSRTLMEAIWAAGGAVKAYDPEAMQECMRLYGERPDLELVGSHDEALQGADALVIVTEWKEFRTLNIDVLKQQLNSLVVFDGRNLYDPQLMQDEGVEYYAIGRGLSLQSAVPS